MMRMRRASRLFAAGALATLLCGVQIARTQSPDSATQQRPEAGAKKQQATPKPRPKPVPKRKPKPTAKPKAQS